MVDFKRLLDEDPEERQRRRDEQFAALKHGQKAKLDRLCAIEEGLTDWEMHFIDDIVKRWEQDEFLTDGVWAKVDEILEQRG